MNNFKEKTVHIQIKKIEIHMLIVAYLMNKLQNSVNFFKIINERIIPEFDQKQL